MIVRLHLSRGVTLTHIARMLQVRSVHREPRTGRRPRATAFRDPATASRGPRPLGHRNEIDRSRRPQHGGFEPVSDSTGHPSGPMSRPASNPLRRRAGRTGCRRHLPTRRPACPVPLCEAQTAPSRLGREAPRAARRGWRHQRTAPDLTLLVAHSPAPPCPCGVSPISMTTHVEADVVRAVGVRCDAEQRAVRRLCCLQIAYREHGAQCHGVSLQLNCHAVGLHLRHSFRNMAVNRRRAL